MYKVRMYSQHYETVVVKRFWFKRQAKRWRDLQRQKKGWGSLQYRAGFIIEVTGPLPGIPGGVSVKLAKNRFFSF